MYEFLGEDEYSQFLCSPDKGFHLAHFVFAFINKKKSCDHVGEHFVSEAAVFFLHIASTILNKII